MRPYRTRWSVTIFVVLAVVVCTLIMLWQLHGAPPDEPDSAPGPTTGHGR